MVIHIPVFVIPESLPSSTDAHPHMRDPAPQPATLSWPKIALRIIIRYVNQPRWPSVEPTSSYGQVLGTQPAPRRTHAICPGWRSIRLRSAAAGDYAAHQTSRTGPAE